MNFFDTTAIEDTMKVLIRDGGVSAKVYTSRPTATTESLSDFVVVKISGNIRDRAAYGECVIAVHLFAKDISNVKNGKKLSVMQEKLYAVLESNLEANGLVLSDNPTVVADVSDGLGFHARMINIQTIIKSS